MSDPQRRSKSRRRLIAFLMIGGAAVAGLVVYVLVFGPLAPRPPAALPEGPARVEELPPTSGPAEPQTPAEDAADAAIAPLPGGPPPVADLPLPRPAKTDDEVPIGYARGNRAPDFTLRSLDGEPVTLSSFRGHMVILDFWASWCGPCRASMPVLHALWEGYRSRGVILIGVSLDRTESDARAYLRANRFDGMIALWDSVATSQAVAQAYGIVGIPRTLVIDAGGIVRFAGHPATLSPGLIDLYL